MPQEAPNDKVEPHGGDTAEQVTEPNTPWGSNDVLGVASVQISEPNLKALVVSGRQTRQAVQARYAKALCEQRRKQSNEELLSMLSERRERQAAGLEPQPSLECVLRVLETDSGQDFLFLLPDRLEIHIRK